MSTDVSAVRAATINRAAYTSETSVDIQLRTWQYIPEDSELLNLHSLCSCYLQASDADDTRSLVRLEPRLAVF
jgi:hypothetical protein